MKRFISVLALFFIFKNSALFAQAGSLDTSFGIGGIVRTKMGSGLDVASSIALQLDGKIVTAGYTSNDAGDKNFALARYRPNGQLDKTFGTKGKITTDLGGNDAGNSMAIQSDGKILVAGYTDRYPHRYIAIVRYLQNGAADTSFGKNGKVVSDSDGIANSIVVQPDGKILIGGGAFILIRYSKKGLADSSFGNNGKVVTELDGYTQGYAIALQSDGKILLAGYQSTSVSQDFLLIRYKPNGIIDSSFGNNGKVITDFGADDEVAKSIAIQADQKIVVAGYSHRNFALARYLLNGSLDKTFGSRGKITTNIETSAFDYGESIAIQADQKIVVAGYSDEGYADNKDFALARYMPDGNLDTTFGTGGKVLTDNLPSDACYSAAIQPDGKIVITGNSAQDFATLRYNGDPISFPNMSSNAFANLQGEDNSKKPSGIHLSPNPAKNVLHISGLSSSLKTVLLFDITGNILQQKVTADTECSFDLKQLQPGTFFVRIDENNKNEMRRFIKQ